MRRITASGAFRFLITLAAGLMLLAAANATHPALAADAAASQPPAPAFTFVIEPSWSGQERTQLESWLSSSGPVMKTVVQVAGPPAKSLTIKVVKESTGHAGEYDPTRHQITLSSLQLSVLVHELNHAIRDGYTLSDSVWEEGLARAGETEDMRLLASQGITEEGYFDLNHGYYYDEYYDQNNVATVGVPFGDIYIEEALTLLRYEQAGYAFSKVMMEDPPFIAQLNAKIFTHANGSLSQKELVAMAAAVQPKVEGLALTAWVPRQHIFDIGQRAGCYLFERYQFLVDLYCTYSSGGVSAQQDVPITLAIYGPNKEVLSRESATTSSLGVASFEPQLNENAGRLKMVATAQSVDGPVKAVFYRQSGPPDGVFGVVTNAKTGTVVLSSPSGQFAPLSVPVTNGAFVAPSLSAVRGQVALEFSGEGRSAKRIIDKDAAPYSVVITAQKG